ncbi:hypothetical protein EV194_10316 [Natronoflexus pectinivorans]|uniref:Uncharacterized protein n=1 Tax=Natronoflexus pectinivorans TaxID=682526 RepID=A0A4R2GN36_9BACT|nr:hypothetical protein EV194_10316 [Natronoflexus pectinivorans]
MKRAMRKPSHTGESKIGVANDYDGEFHPEYSGWKYKFRHMNRHNWFSIISCLSV